MMRKNLIKINEFMHLNSLPILLLMIVFSLINFITMSHNLSYGYTSAFAHFIFILPVYGYCAKKSMVFLGGIISSNADPLNKKGDSADFNHCIYRCFFY